MKITPILNTKLITPRPIPMSSENTTVQNSNRNLGLPMSYAPMISFMAKKHHTKEMSFDDKLLALDGVTCPCCGVKTINREKANYFVNCANKAYTAREFANVMEEVKPYLRRPYLLAVQYVDNIANENPNYRASDVCKMLAAGTGKIILNRFKYEAKHLEGVLESSYFSDIDKVKIQGFVEYLNSVEEVPKWATFLEKLHEHFDEIESPQKWDMYMRLKTKIREPYDYSAALRYDLMKDGLNYQGHVMKQLLSDSISKVAIYNKDQSDKSRYNRFIICNSCSGNPARYSIMQKSPKLEEFAESHIISLSKCISANQLEGEASYLNDVINLMNRISKNKLNLNARMLQGAARSKIFTENKSEYVFDEFEGIPCATCGTEMLTHRQKIDLFDQISKCENLHELNNLAKMHSKNVSPKGQRIVKLFDKNLAENPNITDKTMFKLLQKQIGYELAVDLVKQQIKIKEFAKRYEFNSLDKILLVDFMTRLDGIAARCLAGEEFIYDEYDKAIIETLDKMQNPHKKNLINNVKENITSLHIQDGLVRPLPHVVKKVGSRSKAMFENIFKLASLTVDHTVAKSLGGSDDYSNKIAYCKDCNHEKSGRKFKSWVSKHPEINKNLPLQLEKISEIIKHNESLNSYHDYPTKAAEKAVKLANGKLKIKTEYNTY